MKQTLLFTLSFFAIATFMTACTGQMADKIAVVGNTALSSDSCVAIDKKVMRLDRFTEVVKNTSAFHLEEKATAIQVPGITVSNNRKQMLKDVEKKYAEYAAEHQKNGCKTPMSTGTAQIAIIDNPTLSSDRCAAIDKKVMRLVRFTEVVKNTSAFHLEEKATALPVPGITVSNNRKQMLRDADKKYTEYAAERQKYGCETPIPTRTALMPNKKEVVHKPALSSDPSSDSDKKLMKTDEFTTKVNHTSTVHVEEKAAVLPVTGVRVNHNKEQMVSNVKKKDAQLEVERQKNSAETTIPVSNTKMVNKKVVVSKPTLSSDSCDAIDKELLKLYEFMIMVKNTSAFHLEEKAESMLVPGITVSNNKKKMLKDAERKRAELLTERKKHGCETAEKN